MTLDIVTIIIAAAALVISALSYRHSEQTNIQGLSVDAHKIQTELGRIQRE